jgi:hypothetical protein
MLPCQSEPEAACPAPRLPPSHPLGIPVIQSSEHTVTNRALVAAGQRQCARVSRTGVPTRILGPVAICWRDGRLLSWKGGRAAVLVVLVLVVPSWSSVFGRWGMEEVRFTSRAFWRNCSGAWMFFLSFFLSRDINLTR